MFQWIGNGSVSSDMTTGQTDSVHLIDTLQCFFMDNTVQHPNLTIILDKTVIRYPFFTLDAYNSNLYSVLLL